MIMLSWIFYSLISLSSEALPTWRFKNLKQISDCLGFDVQRDYIFSSICSHRHATRLCLVAYVLFFTVYMHAVTSSVHLWRYRGTGKCNLFVNYIMHVLRNISDQVNIPARAVEPRESLILTWKSTCVT